MKTLTAMIRKQKITINVQKQELHTLRQRYAASEQALQRLRELCRETEQYLWLQVTAGHEILLDRLNLARLTLGEQQINCAQAELQFDQLSTEVEQLLKAVAYAEKALEKFVDLFAERRREKRTEAQRIEWQALDDWAINVAGRRA